MEDWKINVIAITASTATSLAVLFLTLYINHRAKTKSYFTREVHSMYNKCSTHISNYKDKKKIKTQDELRDKVKNTIMATILSSMLVKDIVEMDSDKPNINEANKDRKPSNVVMSEHFKHDKKILNVTRTSYYFNWLWCEREINENIKKSINWGLDFISVKNLSSKDIKRNNELMRDNIFRSIKGLSLKKYHFNPSKMGIDFS